MRQSKLNQAPRCESWVGCIFWKGKQPSRGWVRGSLLHGVPEPWNLFPSQNFCILLKVRFQPLGYSTPHAADFSARRGWIFAFPVQKVEKPRPPPVGRLGGRWHLTSTTLTKVIWSLQPHAADSRTRRGWAQNQARLYLKPDAADFSWYETSKKRMGSTVRKAGWEMAQLQTFPVLLAVGHSAGDTALFQCKSDVGGLVFCIAFFLKCFSLFIHAGCLLHWLIWQQFGTRWPSNRTAFRLYCHVQPSQVWYLSPVSKNGKLPKSRRLIHEGI